MSIDTQPVFPGRPGDIVPEVIGVIDTDFVVVRKVMTHRRRQVRFDLFSCTKTNYFVKTTGTDNTIVACLAVAAILEIVMIIVSVKMGAKPVLDIIPVACGVLTAYALIAFVGSRIAAIGSIMTFENNAQNMADLKGAIIGMIVCAVALIFTIISSFFKVVKD